jgi:high-affinity nickel-transport protein
MTLFDTADGCFMNFAYGWAFARPVRKVYYNLVITALSIAVAFLIGTIEIIGLLADELHIRGGLWDFLANVDINKAGFAIAGLFVFVWAAAIAYWKLGKLDRNRRRQRAGRGSKGAGPAAQDADLGPHPGGAAVAEPVARVLPGRAGGLR